MNTGNQTRGSLGWEASNLAIVVCCPLTLTNLLITSPIFLNLKRAFYLDLSCNLANLLVSTFSSKLEQNLISAKQQQSSGVMARFIVCCRRCKKRCHAISTLLHFEFITSRWRKQIIGDRFQRKVIEKNVAASKQVSATKRKQSM